MSFTHLHLHTLYSLLDGAIRMKDLIKTVKEKGMATVAVTDHGNMFGAIDFYKKAKEAGIKPIFGCEAYVAGHQGPRRTAPRRSPTTSSSSPRTRRATRTSAYLTSMGVPRRVLLPPAHRQADPQGAQRRPHRAHRLPRRRGDQRPASAETWTRAARPRSSTRTSSSPGHFFLEIQCQRDARAGEGQRRTQAARARRWTSRWSPPRRPLHQAGGRRARTSS